MLRFVLTSLHETLLEALSSLPPPPVVVTTPTATPMEEGRDVSKLATRKRKLSLAGKHRCKVSKTTRRKSASSTKVTDFFTASAVSSTPSSLKMEDKETVGSTALNKKLLSSNFDFVKDIFQGELVSQTRCYECDGLTRRAEAFLDVSLAVSSQPGFPGFPVDDSTPSTPNGGRTLARDTSFVGPFSLSHVLSQFCLREKLRGDNKYRCEECGHLAEAERSVLFSHLPLVMTLHLNRFATHAMYWMSAAALTVNKVGGNLAVPLVLRFSSWCTEECGRRGEAYHLIAVVFHTGSSCSTGHYTACVRGKECQVGTSTAMADWIKTDTHWVEFDDELVTVISQEELLDRLSPLTPSTAYILFYSSFE
jgi:ubiquitin C-terminal hydrolase